MHDDANQEAPAPAPEVGKLLRQSAVYSVAALLTAGDAVKVMAGKVKKRVQKLADEAHKATRE